jgi:hypothetical protein
MKTYGITKNTCGWISPIIGFGLSIVVPARVVGYEPFLCIIIGCFCLIVAPKSSFNGWQWNEEKQRSERIKETKQ